MSKIKPRHIGSILGVLAVIIGCYIGWQLYRGHQLAEQYAAQAQKSAQAPGSKGASVASSDPTSPSQSTPSILSPSNSSSPAGSSANPTDSSSNSSTSQSGNYKQLMASTYRGTLQTMQNVKGVTLALQGNKLSLSAYRSSILKSQAAFSSAEEFARANPPTEEKLNPSYQEFLSGISLAKESMGVVLDGISSFSPSSFYAAREMGKKAQQQLVAGYSHF